MKKQILAIAFVAATNMAFSQKKQEIDSLKQVKKELQIKTKANREEIKRLNEKKQYDALVLSISKLQATENKQKQTIEKLNNKTK